MNFVNGKKYRFENCKYPGMVLNVYGTNAASTGRNVCIYPNNDEDIMQDWVYMDDDGIGARLHSAVNADYVLDRSDGTATGSYTDNAHLCKVNYTSQNDSALHFEQVPNQNYYTIRLLKRDLYLTAANNDSGTPVSSVTSAALLRNGKKNVYWESQYSESSANYLKQCWKITESGEESGNKYAQLGWNYVFSDTSNCNGNWGYDPLGNQSPYYHKHMGIDVICDEGIPINAPAAGSVWAVGGADMQTSSNPDVTIDSETKAHDSMGFFIVLKMNDKDPISGKTMYIRFLHLKSLPLLRFGDRVARNERIGYVGNTGESSASHLHLDINTKTSLQWFGDGMTSSNTINPVNFFPTVQFPSHYYKVDYYGD